MNLPRALEKLDKAVPNLRPGSLSGYVVAVALAIIALLLRLSIDRWVEGVQFITFFPAVVVAALLAGIGPGLCAVAASILCWWLFLAFPAAESGALSLADTIAFGMFSVVGSILAVAVGATRIAMAQVRGLAGSLERRVEERTEELRRVEVELRSLTSNLESVVQSRTIELRQSRDLLDSIIESVPDALFLKRANGGDPTYVVVNEAALALTGRSKEEVIGKTDRDLASAANAERALEEDRHVLATNRPSRVREGRLETSRGIRRVETRKFPVHSPGLNEKLILEVARDVTEQRNLEDTLRQTQRMDAVGQLTGGVAHDFNNLLVIIVGNAEFLLDRLGGDGELKEVGEEILRAAERGADLVRRLLAFARKQTLDPKSMNINARIPEITTMLRRVLRDDIIIETSLDDNIWDALIDPSQVDDALVNLAVNARHAMPEGGSLTIETRNVVLDEEYASQYVDVAAGEYVLLAVSDTGSGMDPETVARAFEPFFTTKDVGEGTGLGLSQIYGWIKQSGGHVRIYSELDHGTTVRLYLPKALEEAQSDSDLLEVEPPHRGGNETILVVEDNPNVRRMAVRQLKGLGYNTVEADSGQAALELVRSGLQFDLLFTDVVMPGGITGPGLVEQVKEEVPGLRALLTSGYTELAVSHSGKATGHERMLSKPYRKQELARAVREVLDET